MQKVLVTGATGFIGSNLVSALVTKGYRVKALVRSKEKAASLINTSQVELIEGDITQADTLEKAVQPGDVVIHLAARYNDPAASYEQYRETNVTGTENLIQVSREKTIKRFIHCSTIGIAVHSGMPPPFDENTPYGYNPKDLYERTKYEAEVLALSYYEKERFPVVIMRPVPPIGPGDRNKIKFYKLLQKGIVVGNGEVPKHFIYIDDLTDAFELAVVRDGIEGEIFILGGRPVVCLKDIIDWAAEELKIRRPRRIPTTPVKFLSFAVETICKHLNVTPPLYQSRLDFFTKGFFFDTRKAEEVLGFMPKVTIREGVARTVEWYRRNGLL